MVCFEVDGRTTLVGEGGSNGLDAIWGEREGPASVDMVQKDMVIVWRGGTQMRSLWCCRAGESGRVLYAK